MGGDWLDMFWLEVFCEVVNLMTLETREEIEGKDNWDSEVGGIGVWGRVGEVGILGRFEEIWGRLIVKGTC